MSVHIPVPRHRTGRAGVLRRLPVGVVTVLAVLAAGCSADAAADRDAAPVATSQVRVDDDFFEPETVEVPAGTEVTWTWVGNNAHNVTAEEFTSDTQSSGTFSHTFDRPGTYSYECTLHPGMDGTVIVTDTARSR